MLAAVAPVQPSVIPPPKVVKSADDLPRCNYFIEGQLADLLGNQTALAPLAAKLLKSLIEAQDGAVKKEHCKGMEGLVPKR